MTTTRSPVEHRDAMLDVLTEITQDCAQLGLAPCSVYVGERRYPFVGWSVRVQFTGEDAVAVDALGDAYDLEDAVGEPGGNYTRDGRLDVAGCAVEVSVFTGYPKVPAFPADYAPVAVTA